MYMYSKRQTLLSISDRILRTRAVLETDVVLLDSNSIVANTPRGIPDTDLVIADPNGIVAKPPGS